jgi:hypothetical protein
MLVAEIGEAGQARLEMATAHLAGEALANEVAAAYALRAGMSVERGSVDDGLAPAFLVVPAARAVVAGSRAALAALRSGLGMR